MKKNEGITLIALIITVIVMLVLVAVSIRMIVNSDILKTTQDATKEYELAKVKDDLETELANITIDKKYKNKGTTKTYYEYLVEKYGAENVKETITGTRYTITYQGYEIDVSVNEYNEIKLAESYNVADIKWIYEDNDDGTINITGIDLSNYDIKLTNPSGTRWYDDVLIEFDKAVILVPEEISGKKVVNFSLHESGHWYSIISGIIGIIFPDNIKNIDLHHGCGWSYPDLEELILGTETQSINFRILL